MNKLFVTGMFAFLWASIPVFAARPTFNEWRDPQLNEVNRLPMHSWFKPDNESSSYMSISGMWNFNFVEDADQRPEDFYLCEFDDSNWARMPVPGNWELNGYGDPLYVNTGYPWKGWFTSNPPEVPVRHNHVGSYRKHFEIPADWTGKQVVLHIGSATSCIYVWVNGKFVGYSEDSKLEAEFDVTPYIKGGSNLLAFQVFRWCDGTYLEDQDFFRLSGITRECYLWARPKAHIEDIEIQTPLDDSFTSGRFVASVCTSKNAEGKTLRCRLFNPDGSELHTSDARIRKSKVKFDFNLESLDLWSAETPALYRAEFTIEGTGEVITQNVGFRDVRIENGQLKVNGQPVLIKGANRHEIDPEMGYHITLERALQDITIMKENNINAVRTCHYPSSNEWYELCDKYGIYVVAEADIESHGMGYKDKTIAKRPDYRLAHLQRNQRNVERNFNHPSIIVWSLGNEAGNGPNFDACYDWVKEKDPSRPVQYERAEGGRNTDIMCPMYMDYSNCENYLKTDPQKPLIQCEYAHAMGNSVGAFDEYWNLVRKYPKYQGGFIWDFVDQSIRKIGKDGVLVRAYGGDWNSFDPSDDNFCCNGLIDPDRRLNPHMNEVRYYYQNIWTSYDRGILTVKNENFFRNLGDIYLEWTLLSDGQPVSKGIVWDINAAPQETAQISLPINPGAGDSENILNLKFIRKTAEGLLSAGTVVATGEHIITPYRFGIASQSSGDLKCEFENEDVVISNESFKIRIDKTNASVKEYQLGSVEIIDPEWPLVPNFWRAPTDNDFGPGLHQKYSKWKSPAIRATRFEVSESDGIVHIDAVLVLDKIESTLNLSYKISAEGSLEVCQSLNASANDPDMFRFGMRFATPPGFENLLYYGRGPWENYSDRKASSLLGIYRQTVDEQYYPYVRPQESGTRSDIRWWTIGDQSGRGIKITSDKPFNISALHYSIEALDEGDQKHHTHSEEITRDPRTFVCLDVVQLGLGGVTSWRTIPLPKYQVKCQPMTFRFKIEPHRTLTTASCASSDCRR